MLGRAYTISASFAGKSSGAAQDLFRLSAPSDAVVVVDRIIIGQSGSETSEARVIEVGRCSTDGTGTTTTAEAMEVGSPAYGGSAVTDLTVDTTSTDVLLFAPWNVLSIFEWLPTPEERIVISPSGRIYGRIDDAGTGLTFQVTVAFREIGG